VYEALKESLKIAARLTPLRKRVRVRRHIED